MSLLIKDTQIEFNEVESLQLMEFITTHKCDKPAYTFKIVIPPGIGYVIRVTCICGGTTGITDFDLW